MVCNVCRCPLCYLKIIGAYARNDEIFLEMVARGRGMIESRNELRMICSVSEMHGENEEKSDEIMGGINSNNYYVSDLSVIEL